MMDGTEEPDSKGKSLYQTELYLLCFFLDSSPPSHPTQRLQRDTQPSRQALDGHAAFYHWVGTKPYFPHLPDSTALPLAKLIYI